MKDWRISTNTQPIKHILPPMVVICVWLSISGLASEFSFFRDWMVGWSQIQSRIKSGGENSRTPFKHNIGQYLSMTTETGNEDIYCCSWHSCWWHWLFWQRIRQDCQYLNTGDGCHCTLSVCSGLITVYKCVCVIRYSSVWLPPYKARFHFIYRSLNNIVPWKSQDTQKLKWWCIIT